MSESDDRNDGSMPGEGVGPAALPHIDSPPTMPDDGSGRSAEVPPAAASAEPPKSEPPKSEVPKSEASKSETPKSETSATELAVAKSMTPFSPTRSTALVLTLPRPEETTAGPAPEPDARPARPRRFAFSPAAMSMVAVLLGAAIGSGATASLLYLNATPSAAPADPTSFTAALGRIDHELATLKASIEGSAKQSTAQIAKIADRMERTEKSQAETGAKVARTAESLDRLDHRLAANAGGAGEATGSTSAGTLAPGPGDRTASLADPKRAAVPAPTPVLEGWALRDVFNGGAMIQTPRNGILEVIPGDTLPGLGRIEAVKRLDGRWVVVTSRGLIVPR
jgi:hypothetical protein